MHEAALRAGNVHQFLCDPIGGEGTDAVFPHLDRFAHGNPHVGVDNIGAHNGGGGVFTQFNGGSRFGGNGTGRFDQRIVGKIAAGSAGYKVHAHLGATDHEGVAHIIMGFARINQFSAFQRAEMLLDGKKVGQDLGGVKLVGEPVPDGNACVFRQFLDQVLAVATVLNAVEHPTQYPCGIGDAFLFTHLRTRGIEIDGVHTQVGRRYLKGATGAGAGLFKKQGNALALVIPMGDARLLFGLIVGRQVEQIFNFLGGKIQ